jgi:hypothetical protein
MALSKQSLALLSYTNKAVRFALLCYLQLRKTMEKDAANASNFDNIDASLFALCLDDYASGLDLDISHRNLFHGQKARNRWFDKAMQFIVENNGRAGVNGEVRILLNWLSWSEKSGERDEMMGIPKNFFLFWNIANGYPHFMGIISTRLPTLSSLARCLRRS